MRLSVFVRREEYRAVLGSILLEIGYKEKLVIWIHKVDSATIDAT
jgi:hypothetical protein